jgi:hypothetical protein
MSEKDSRLSQDDPVDIDADVYAGVLAAAL